MVASSYFQVARPLHLEILVLKSLCHREALGGIHLELRLLVRVRSDDPAVVSRLLVDHAARHDCLVIEEVSDRRLLGKLFFSPNFINLLVRNGVVINVILLGKY